jgi:hypothetical protein
MKNTISMALMLASCGVAMGQITAVLNHFPSRSPEITIRNDSAVSVTAFAVSMAPAAGGNEARASFVYFADAAVDADRGEIAYPLPIAPNQEYAIPVPSGFRSGHAIDLFEPPVDTAAVFEDGSTSGDTSLLARLMARRGNQLQAVELARDILTEAGKRNVPRTQLVEQFRTLADSVDHWYLPPEQRVGRGLYRSIAEKLANLPTLQAGAAFPPAAFVEQETALLNRQRTMLLEARPGLLQAAGQR